MVGREAAAHIMLVLMTSSGVVAAAAKAPAAAPMQKSSCGAVSPPSASARKPWPSLHNTVACSAVYDCPDDTQHIHAGCCAGCGRLCRRPPAHGMSNTHSRF